MNRLLTPLTNSIVAHNGTIDKYIGDAIMAFWNAPLDDPSQESNACHAALDMLKGVSALNQEREKESSETNVPFVPIKVGIGINTGNCVVGNMGSDMRFQYTAMGDSVNLASRLEGQAAVYGVPMLIGARTAEAVSDQFALLQVDRIRVVGKQRAETIFTIAGDAETARSSEFESLREHWTRLLTCYQKRDWAGVIELAELCRPLCEKFGLRELAELYRDRGHRFSRNAPPADWDGVSIAETK